MSRGRRRGRDDEYQNPFSSGKFFKPTSYGREKRDSYDEILELANLLGDDSTTAIEAGKDGLAEDALAEGFKISPVEPPPGQPEAPEKPTVLDGGWLTEQGFWKPENVAKEEEIAKKHWQDKIPTVKRVGRIYRSFGRQTGEADVTFPDKTVRRMPYTEAYKFIKQPDETWADYAARRQAESSGLKKALPSLYDKDARVIDAATDPVKTTRKTAAGVVQETTPGTPGIDASVDVRERHGLVKQEPYSLAGQLAESESLIEKVGDVAVFAALPFYQAGLRLAKDTAGAWKAVGVNPTTIQRVAQRQLNMIAKAGGTGFNLINLIYEAPDFLQSMLPTLSETPGRPQSLQERREARRQRLGIDKVTLGDYVDFRIPTEEELLKRAQYEPNTRTAFGDDQITKNEWGNLAAYAANRAHIVGDSSRVLGGDLSEQAPVVEPIHTSSDVTGLPMPQKMAQVTFANGKEEVMPLEQAMDVLAEHRKKNPKGHWEEEEWDEFSADRFWDNTLAEMEGLVSIIPAVVSGVMWVGSGRRLEQVAGTSSHYLVGETAAFTGEHLAMLAKGDIDKFVETGLISAIADVGLLWGGVSTAATARASQLLRKAEHASGASNSASRIQQAANNIIINENQAAQTGRQGQSASRASKSANEASRIRNEVSELESKLAKAEAELKRAGQINRRASFIAESSLYESMGVVDEAQIARLQEAVANTKAELDSLRRKSVAADLLAQKAQEQSALFTATDEIVGSQEMRLGGKREGEVSNLPSELQGLHGTYDDLTKELSDAIEAEGRYLNEARQTLDIIEDAAKTERAAVSAVERQSIHDRFVSKNKTKSADALAREAIAGLKKTEPPSPGRDPDIGIKQALESISKRRSDELGEYTTATGELNDKAIDLITKGKLESVPVEILYRYQRRIRNKYRSLDNGELGANLELKLDARLKERPKTLKEEGLIAGGDNLPSPLKMKAQEIAKERNQLQSNLRLAGHEKIKNIAERLASGEMQYVDLLAKGWTLDDIADLDRLRALSGPYSPLMRGQAEKIKRAIDRLDKKGEAAAQELRNIESAKQKQAGKAAVLKAKAAANNIKQLMKESIENRIKDSIKRSPDDVTPLPILEDLKGEPIPGTVRTTIESASDVEEKLRAGLANTADEITKRLEALKAEQSAVQASAVRRLKVKRSTKLTPEQNRLLDAAVHWEGVAQASRLLHYAFDPVGFIGAGNRMKNWLIDRYGTTYEGALSTVTKGTIEGSKLLSKQAAHELLLASRYWLRSPTRTDSVPLALYNAFAREAEGEIHEASFKIRTALKEISDNEVVVVTSEGANNPEKFIQDLASKYKTTVKTIVSKNKLGLDPGFSWDTRTADDIHKQLSELGKRLRDQKKDIDPKLNEEITSRLIVAIDELPDKDIHKHYSLLQDIVENIADQGDLGKRLRDRKKRIDAELKEVIANPSKIHLQEGQRILVRDVANPERRNKRVTTVSQALHYEHADLTEHVTREIDEIGGIERVRFVANEDSPDVWKDWTVTANHYLEIIDLSRQTTIESIELGLLKDLPGLHEIWAPNVYPFEARLEALEKRVKEKWGAEIADAKKTGAPAKEIERLEKQMKNDLERKTVDYKIREAQRTTGGGQTLEGIGGESLRQRKLAVPDPETGKATIPIEDRIDKYGMAADLYSTAMIGILRQKRDIATARMWKRIANSPDIMSHVEKPGWVLVKNTDVDGTMKVKKYGNSLPERFYLHPDVYWDLKGTGQMMDWSKRLPVQVLSLWKGMKTAMSIGSHVTNALTNTLVLGPMAGLSPLNPNDAKFFGQAAKEFWTGGSSKSYQQFVIDQGRGPTAQINKLEMVADTKKAYGALYTGISGQSKNAMDTFIKIFEMTADPGNEKTWSIVKKAIPKKAQALKDLIIDYPGLFYQAGDDFFRYALYLKNTAKGMGSVEAAQVSRKAFAAYESIAPMFRIMATSMIGKPFLAFDAAMIPQVTKWIRDNPVRANIWVDLYESMTDINFAASEMTEERWDEYQSNLPRYDVNRMAGIRKLFPTLGQDALGQERYWNWQRIAIGSRFFPEKGEEGFSRAHATRAFASESPYAAGLYLWLGNRDIKFNRYYDPADPTTDAAKSQWAWQTALPSIVPGGYAWNRVKDSGFRFFSNNEIGRPRRGRLTAESPAEALLYYFTGQRVATYDPIERAGLKKEEEKFENISIERKGPKAVYERAIKSFVNDTHRFIKTPDQLRGFLEKIAEDPKGLAAMKQNTIDDEVKAAWDARNSARHARFAKISIRAQDHRMGLDPSSSPAAVKAANDATLKTLNNMLNKTMATTLNRKGKLSDFGKYSDVLEFIEAQKRTEGWKGEARITVYNKIIKNLTKLGRHKEAAEFVRDYLQYQKPDAYLETWHTLDKNKKRKTTWYEMKLRGIRSSQRRAIKKRAGVN